MRLLLVGQDVGKSTGLNCLLLAGYRLNSRWFWHSHWCWLIGRTGGKIALCARVRNRSLLLLLLLLLLQQRNCECSCSCMSLIVRWRRNRATELNSWLTESWQRTLLLRRVYRPRQRLALIESLHCVTYDLCVAVTHLWHCRRLTSEELNSIFEWPDNGHRVTKTFASFGQLSINCYQQAS